MTGTNVINLPSDYIEIHVEVLYDILTVDFDFKKVLMPSTVRTYYGGSITGITINQDSFVVKLNVMSTYIQLASAYRNANGVTSNCNISVLYR